jgi:methionine synthase II (cobalamin-independent)
MKVGDLVKFHTSGWVFNHANARYENPGVIIEDVSGASRAAYRVLWANKKMTVEHASYLQQVKENENR